MCYTASMEIETIVAAGLTPAQAEAYALLMERGEMKPRAIATALGLTRTNAYKVMDQLAADGLVTKHESGKTIAYSPANPVALTNLSAQFRAEATAREEAANTLMQSLLHKYYEHADELHVSVAGTPQEVVELYRKQIALEEELYFIRTNADIPSLGFDTMHEIRTAPARHGVSRHGILSVLENGTTNPKRHKRSNLDVTWLEAGNYTSPVEWSATKSSLLLVTYGKTPQAALIIDPFIGQAFIQIWGLLKHFLHQQPTHQKQTAKS